MSDHALDESFMKRCIQLASSALGHTAPNPLVGSVIVHGGKIIGEGFHKQYGKAHAEVNAIASVKDQSLLETSTLYVNLEPCSHIGKTPPCAELIIEKKIPRVVIGTMDPNPLVGGKGIELLKANGIEVIHSVLQDECLELNKRFFTFFNKKRPYVILKWAQTKDGFIDRIRNGNKGINWITGDDAKRIVHLWRSQEQSILVGAQTVRNDNPTLTVREVEGQNPIRLVISKHGEFDLSSNVLNDRAETIIYNDDEDKEDGNVKWKKIDYHSNVFEQVLSDLYQRKIQSVIVEGGASTLNGFIESGLWDEARILTAQSEFGDGVHAPKIKGRIFDQIDLDSCRIQYFRHEKSS